MTFFLSPFTWSPHISRHTDPAEGITDSRRQRDQDKSVLLIGACALDVLKASSSPPPSPENGSVFTLALDLDSMAQPLTPY